jgi:glycosyltransferase involved in cell wall biosynthesis
MTTPRFSVIVPTYNRPDLLMDALTSVLSQTTADFECIVVDDGSPVLPSLPPDQRVRLVPRAQNRGAAAARNDGVAAARGMFVAFLDDDDVWIPDRLQAITGALDRAPVVICWSRYFDAPPTSGRWLAGDVRDTILEGMTPSVGATVVRRDVIPRFDERFQAYEDVEWWLRLSACAEVTTVPANAHLVRRHSGTRARPGLRRWVAGNQLLLATHAEYFDDHTAAQAFRWFRLGIRAAQAGDRRVALGAMARAFRRRPSTQYAAHLCRLLMPAQRLAASRE